MRYLSFLDTAGRQRVGAVQAGSLRKAHDLTDLLPDSGGSPMRRLITAEAGVGALLAEAPMVEVGTVLPVIPDPSKIVAAPVNYRAHQAEMNEAGQIGSLGVFLKAPSSVIGGGGVVRLPYTDRRFDQEGELAVVIGRRTRDVTEDDALDAVFGYTNLLDMTMRGGEDRSVRKSFDTFTRSARRWSPRTRSLHPRIFSYGCG
jgi:2-keto-4-pentenoate hydratase/2-oxohepta-3-ene-1,7-dioic acid hydratase in catechol pathway